MKQLFSILIALQLIMLPLPSVALTSSTTDKKEIQTTEEEKPKEEAKKEEPKKPSAEKEKDQATNNINEINNKGGTNADYDARSQGGAGYAGFAKQILGASTAIIGSNIITSCSFGGKVPSILAFMAGSIAYLISEISGGKKQNKEHKERLERIEQIKKQVAENKGGGDVQRVLIEQRLEEEEKILAFVKERNKWAMAILAIYTTAAILAITEEMTGMASGNAIGMTTCATLAAQYASPCGKAYAACYAKHMAACTPAQPTGQMAAKAAFMSTTSVATGTSTCAGTTLYVTACEANLNAYLAIAFANCQPLAMGNVAVGGITGNLFSAAYGVGFSAASAGKLQDLLQLAVSLTNMFTTALSTQITALYSYPIPRAATFGAHAAMMGVIISGLSKVAKQTEANIEELRKVVSQFRETTDDVNGFGQGGLLAGDMNDKYQSQEYQAGATDSVSFTNQVNAMKGLKPLNSKSKTCFSNEKGSMDVSEGACTKSVHVKPINVKIKRGSNKNLESSLSLINDLNRALEQGNTDAASSISSDLASISSALRSDLLSKQDEYNKTLSKKDKVDFAAKEKKILDQMEKVKNEVFDAFEKEQGIKIASLSPSFRGASLDDAADLSASQKITTEAASEKIALPTTSAVANTEAQALLTESTTDADTEDNGVLFGGSVDSSNPFGLNEEAYRAAKANGYLHLHSKHGAGVDGIAREKENLFKVISNRYFLSYPKFMRKKVVENEKQ